MAAKSLRDYNFRKQVKKNLKEATFIFKPVQNEANINSLEFHIGASNRITWKQKYYLTICKFQEMQSQVKMSQGYHTLQLCHTLLSKASGPNP